MVVWDSRYAQKWLYKSIKLTICCSKWYYFRDFLLELSGDSCLLTTCGAPATCDEISPRETFSSLAISRRLPPQASMERGILSTKKLVTCDVGFALSKGILQREESMVCWAKNVPMNQALGWFFEIAFQRHFNCGLDDIDGEKKSMALHDHETRREGKLLRREMVAGKAN